MTTPGMVHVVPDELPSYRMGKNPAMDHTQATILLIEVGIIALLIALGYLPKRP